MQVISSILRQATGGGWRRPAQSPSLAACLTDLSGEDGQSPSKSSDGEIKQEDDKRRSTRSTRLSGSAASLPATRHRSSHSGQPAASGSRVSKKRSNLDTVHGEAPPSKQGRGAGQAAVHVGDHLIKLGCSKCRFKPTGCGRCRALVHASQLKANAAASQEAPPAQEAPAPAKPSANPPSLAAPSSASPVPAPRSGAAPAAVEIIATATLPESTTAKLGCSRCRFSKNGCSRCQAKAAAAAGAGINAAEPKETDAAVVEDEDNTVSMEPPAEDTTPEEAAPDAAVAEEQMPSEPEAADMDVVLPSEVVAAPPTVMIELGCSKCRFSQKGCSRCRAKAAAAPAAGMNAVELNETEAAVPEDNVEAQDDNVPMQQPAQVTTQPEEAAPDAAVAEEQMPSDPEPQPEAADMDVVLPADELAAPPTVIIKLGCSKCRFSQKGCSRCRAKAAAAPAAGMNAVEPEEAEAAVALAGPEEQDNTASMESPAQAVQEPAQVTTQPEEAASDAGIAPEQMPAEPAPEPEAMDTDVVLPTEEAAVEATVPTVTITLGCSKCRFSKKGCGRCRYKAMAAPPAAPAPAQEAVAEEAPAPEVAQLEVDPAKPKDGTPVAAAAPSPEAPKSAFQRRQRRLSSPLLGPSAPNLTSSPQGNKQKASPAAKQVQGARSVSPIVQRPSPLRIKVQLGCKKCWYKQTGCPSCRSTAPVLRVTKPEPTKRAAKVTPAEKEVLESLAEVFMAATAAAAGPISPEKEPAAVDAAPEEEAPQPAVQLGCSKCRYSAKGCGRCRLRAGAAALVQRATNAMPSARGGSAARRAAQQALLDSAQDIWAAPPVPEEPVGPQPPTAAEMLREREEEIKNMEAACQDAAWWDPADPSKVSRAKAALHVSAAVGPGQLPLCRERQIEAVDSWLSDRLRSAQGGSLYLSGLPGTGKSLTALELARRCGRHAAAPGSKCTLPPALLAINCMRLTHPRQVVQRILAGYGTACRRQSVGPDGDDPLTLVPDEEEYIEAAAARRAGAGDIEDAKEALRRIALQQLPSWPAPSHRRASGGKGAWGEGSQRGERGMIVVVLDELDGLLSGQQGDALVGELFALAAAPRSRLVLLGIANSIDLVQQLMRPGGAFHRHGLRPAHEVFPAYLRGQVSRLVTQRLAALPGPVFEPNAVEFCARKVANGSGDMRLALEAAAQAVEILAAETEDAAKKKAEKEAMDKAAAAAGAGDKEPEEKEMGEGDAPSSAAPKAPRVGMRHMAKALSRLTGGIGSSNANVAAIRMLPVPQQLLMCTVGKLLGEKLGAKGMTVRVPSAAPSLASAAAKFIGHAGIPTALVDEGPAPVPGSAADAKQRRASGPGKHELTVADLQEAHQALCKKVGVAGYSGSEFMTAVEVLQTQGLVDIVGPRGDLKRSRVTLRVAEDDVLMALVDVPVLKDVVGA